MDIARPDLARKKKLRRTIYIAAALITLPVVTLWKLLRTLMRLFGGLHAGAFATFAF